MGTPALRTKPRCLVIMGRYKAKLCRYLLVELPSELGIYISEFFQFK